jgi:hypothetical protein
VQVEFCGRQNCAYIWSTRCAYTRESEWNLNSSTLEANLPQHDRPSACNYRPTVFYHHFRHFHSRKKKSASASKIIYTYIYIFLLFHNDVGNCVTWNYVKSGSDCIISAIQTVVDNTRSRWRAGIRCLYARKRVTGRAVHPVWGTGWLLLTAIDCPTYHVPQNVHKTQWPGALDGLTTPSCLDSCIRYGRIKPVLPAGRNALQLFRSNFQQRETGRKNKLFQDRYPNVCCHVHVQAYAVLMSLGYLVSELEFVYCIHTRM